MAITLLRSALALGLLTNCLAQFGPELESNTASPMNDDGWAGVTGSSTVPLSSSTVWPGGFSPKMPGIPTKPPVTRKPATYWITYSKTVRPGHPMVFQIQIFKGTSPVDLTINLRDVQGNVLLTHGPVTVMPMVPNTVTVDIPLDMKKPNGDQEWYGYQDYTVEVMGRGQEMSIKEKGRASYQEKAFSIFVQTDKAMYKPSQKVQFRTLAMTPDMKVLRDVKQDIVVYDAKGNRILQYKGVQASESLGVVEKTFSLASSVPAGKWRIKVSIQGVEEEKEFEVSDYVLPRFEVEVDGPDYGLNSDLLYTFTVKAKYTFGKPVTDGSVVVNIIVMNQHYYNEEEKPRVTRRGRLDENGEMKVEVLVDEMRKIASGKYNDMKVISEWLTFEITANVTERRTAKTHSGTHNMNFYSTPIKMEFLGITPDSFKSGLDYTAYIEVTKRDGSLFTQLELRNMSVLINVTYTTPITKTTTMTPTTVKPGTDDKLTPTLDENYGGRRPGYYPRNEKHQLPLDNHRYRIPETGWVVVTFRVPDEAIDLTIKATTESLYKDIQQYRFVDKSRSPSQSFLQLSVLNKKPRVGDTVRVQAKATDSMKLLNYQVFSKGLLVAGNSVEGDAKSLDFQFTATKAMSPSMSIVAFYVRDDGEFVNDALSLSVEGLFDNAVQVEFNKKEVKPGESVNLIVKGQRDSLVFLLVIDKSVKLLKSGNDITQDMILEELSSYDYGNYGNWRYMFTCGWPSYFGGQDAQSVFDNAGVIVMTDGLVYNYYNDDYNDKFTTYPELEAPLATGNPDFADEGGSSNRNPTWSTAGRTRKYFPENWLWDISTIDSRGEVAIPLTAPDTITSWLASAFSVNPRSGLSVAENPAEVTTFRNMFISLDLPSFIVREEDFCFNASVFSYYPGEIPILLTLDPSSDFTNIMVKKESNGISLTRNQLYYSYFMGFLSENDVKTTTFCFTPLTIGEITLRVSALTDVDGLSDAVERKLRVKPEGIPHTTTVSNLVTPVNGIWAETVPAQFPADTVADSETIAVNIAGNLLGPVFDNLEDLLKKPYGCGEQNMINFAPIMSLVDFFYTTNTITEEFKQKAIDYMLIGYQKEILYEHGQTGGYSTFGNQDNTREAASMWLTAFVTKCFSQAEILDMKHQNILAMDVDLIYRSASWMVDRQNQVRNGSFVENGRVFNKGLQGGSSQGIALTSYTVISLHHALQVLQADPDFSTRMIENGMSRGVQYLEDNLGTLTDPYDVCITTYALTLVGSSLSNSSFVMMENLAKKGFGMTNWERPKQDNRETYYWSRGSDAINIEMTSYALLTYSLLGIGTSHGLPVVRWLSKQKGPNGGFISTQDTVIGIEALTTVAKDLYGAEFVPMTITVNTRDNVGIQGTSTFQVNKDNEMILQRHDIPYKAGSSIEVTAQTPSTQDTSKSTVLVDVVFNYNVLSETEPRSYGMEHKISGHPDGFYLSVMIWTQDGEPASMTILEVDVPAGFDPDEEEILKTNGDLISKIDRKEDRINVYINTDVIRGKGIKLELSMLHTGGTLAKSKGKTYKVYNYYEPEMELTKQYYLADDGDFCSKVPEFGICRYQ